MMNVEVIAKLVGDQDCPLFGIEIGCLDGTFAAGILSKLKNLHLTSIDVQPNWKIVYSKLISGNLASEPKFNLIHSSSDNAIRFFHRMYDFVFIDGCHSYEQTRKDILNYWQVVKSGGLIAGHNYENGTAAAHPGVAKAVMEIFGKGNFTIADDLVWYKYV